MHRVYFGHYLLMIWKIEPHHHNNNFDEKRYHTVNHLTNTIIECTGAPAYTWLISLIYVCFILNQTHTDGINGITSPKAKGYTADISPF